jgi:hypothetical protein
VRLRDCKATVIDNCGHIPQVAQLQETLTAVRGFLQM